MAETAQEIAEEGALGEGNLGEFEPPKGAHLPIIRLNARGGATVPSGIVREVERACLVTMRACGIPLQKYQTSGPQELVDLAAKDELGRNTFPRKPGSDQTHLVVVISAAPIYDTKGRETIALCTEDNKVLLNLGRIEDAFCPGPKARRISRAKKAGIVAVEEVVHFVQHVYWGRERTSTEDFVSEDRAKEHDSDPGEMEKAIWRQKIYRVLYPELDLKIRGLDQ